MVDSYDENLPDEDQQLASRTQTGGTDEIEARMNWGMPEITIYI